MTQQRKLPYREKLAEHSAIWSDEYALTMSQAFFTNGKHDQNTTFHAYIRKNPFGGSFLITAGQNIVFEWLKNNWTFDADDIELLRQRTLPNLKTGKMERLYSDAFLDMLANAKLELTIEAMPEGELAFPDEPVYRIRGPLWQCLMVEAAILNIMNSQSLFATLASRLVEVADGAPILEFGLRRAQAIGGLEPSRGAYVGGVAATSNMLAGKYYQIPTSGTFAHAMVMVYEDELEAFRDYARAMPDNTIFLVDTYDTIEGVKRAVQTCRDLGIKMKGIRLDSGDLAALSIEARQILDEAGFADAKIAASNDLDEKTIRELKVKGARIDVWGVGTNLTTSSTQPALGAVYKVGAVYFTRDNVMEVVKGIREGRVNPADVLREVIKLSQEQFKVTIPGEVDVLRFKDEDGTMLGDIIYDYLTPEQAVSMIRESYDKGTGGLISNFNGRSVHVERPLTQYFLNGVFVGAMETVHQARQRAAAALKSLPAMFKRLENPVKFPVGLARSLFDKRKKKIELRRQPAQRALRP